MIVEAEALASLPGNCLHDKRIRVETRRTAVCLTCQTPLVLERGDFRAPRNPTPKGS